MLYKCKSCNYETILLSNYNKHIATKKHTKMVQQQPILADANIKLANSEKSNNIKKTNDDDKDDKNIICNLCNTSFSHNSSLSRHKKKCIISEYEKKIRDIEFQKIKEELETLKQEKQYNQNLNVANTHNINGLIQINMKTLTFLNTYFNNAPALQDFSHYFKDMYAFFIDYKKFPQIENTNNILFDGKEVNKDDYISDKIIFLQQENNIVKYFSDKIIEHFRNKDFPELQSYWSSDTFRNNYNIRTEYKNVSTWHTDKQGLIISEKILEPLLDFVTDITSAKLMSLAEKNKKEKELHKKMPIVKKQQTLTEFNLSVAHKEIQPEIMKKIAPSFFLDMDKEKLKINMRKLE